MRDGTEPRTGARKAPFLFGPLSFGAAKWWGALILVLVVAPCSGLALASPPCPVASAELLEDDRLEKQLSSLIKKAKEEIWVGNYSFKAGEHRNSPPDRLLRELVNAHRRGLKVHVLLERPEERGSDLARDNERSARLLQKGGVPVYWDRADRRSHMKVAVVDKRFVIIGSHNLTASGLRHNHELSVLVDSPCLAERTIRYLLDILREAGVTPSR